MGVLRDLSVMLLTVQAFVLMLIPLALFGGLVYGLWMLLRHRNLPTWLRMAREYLMMGLSYVNLAMEAVARPVFKVRETTANVEGWIQAIVVREDKR
ncbi:MAG: hypothetical protein PVH41_11415 [Anaerolineae bacterium]